MEGARRDLGTGPRILRSWIRALTFDGLALLAVYLVSIPALFWLGPPRWLALWAFAAPPLAYLAMYLVLGAPLYRYQVGLHPFMLATIALAAGVVVRGLRRRAGSRELAGSPSHDPA